jgi:hypothetical protein
MPPRLCPLICPRLTKKKLMKMIDYIMIFIFSTTPLALNCQTESRE